MIKLRLATPERIIDISRIKGLAYIREEGGFLKIGALTREAQLEESSLIARKYPIILNATKMIADPSVRNLATVGGNLALTGTHIGCDTSNCGACTVLLNGRSVKSCNVLAVQADGQKVLTIEGMAQGGQLHPLQEGFKEEHGLQCGFCTPGMIMRAADLLAHNPNPTEDEIRWGISGNLCRCTGYNNIVKAIEYAAEKNQEGRHDGGSACGAACRRRCASKRWPTTATPTQRPTRRNFPPGCSRFAPAPTTTRRPLPKWTRCIPTNRPAAWLIAARSA